MAWVIHSLTDRKYRRDLLQCTVYPRDGANIVHTFHSGRYQPEAGARGIVECLRQPDATSRCSLVDGLGIGVITSPEVLRLPEDVKQFLDHLS